MIKRLVQKFLLGDALGSAARHALSTLGGYLVGMGLDQALVGNFTGAALALVPGLVQVLLAYAASRVKASVK